MKLFIEAVAIPFGAVYLALWIVGTIAKWIFSS